MVYLRNSAKDIFKTATTIWQKRDLPKLLDIEILKMCLKEELISKIPNFKTLNAFNSMSLDNQAFVAVYYKRDCI